jgi:hypothetical protein
MNVLLCGDIKPHALETLLTRYGMNLETIVNGKELPGSYWEAPEAGLIGNTLYVREDTPVHSALHEACHYICMDEHRRQSLHTDAGGDYEEEDAVCFLQIILAELIPEMGRARMLRDMDEWGYTFRLGSAQNWFEQDAEDANQWLIDSQILKDNKNPTWRVRQNSQQ